MTRLSTPLLAARVDFQRALRRWYRALARPLPWREAPSLYRTVVSEFMLQQTQVRTVLPYFARWMRELPDFASLAAAPEARVLKLWEGLGYYSRARNLHRLAQVLMDGPAPPPTADGWRKLPGVGPYTAAAITSIAFGARAACVDGNVVRILARLTADATAFRDSASAARTLAPLASALLPARAPGDHNQAMMELGATVCLRRNPRCTDCPVRLWCMAAKRGRPESFPRLAVKAIERRAVTRVWCEHQGALLFHLAPARARRFASIHELPTAEQAGIADTRARRGALLAIGHRSITRFRITETIHAAVPPRKTARAGLVWVPLTALDAITLSGPHRRWVAAILAQRKPAADAGSRP